MSQHVLKRDRCPVGSGTGLLLLASLALLAPGCCTPPTTPATPTSRPARPGPARPAGALDPEQTRTLQSCGVDPRRIRCNRIVRWEPTLDRYARQLTTAIVERTGISPSPELRATIEHTALGYLVRSYFDQTTPHNLGVMVLRGHHFVDPRGRRRPLLIFRSAVTTARPGPRRDRSLAQQGPSPCFKSLLDAGHVRHIVNLYGGTFPFHDVIAREKRYARARGATYLDLASVPELKWRRLVEQQADYRANLGEAMQRMARLIREHLLRPGGKPPRGNLYVHCGGGMHRSGMVFGVLRRCINGEPMQRVEREYRRHTDYRSDAEPGGFERLNLQFIADFDCKLLGPGAAR